MIIYMKTIQIRQVIGRIACNKTLYYVIDQIYDVIKHLNVMVKYICVMHKGMCSKQKNMKKLNCPKDSESQFMTNS